MRLNSGQRISIGILTLFLSYLLISVFLNSAGRESLLSASASGVEESGLIGDSLRDGRLKLTDFHRIEVKDGRAVWEIKAKEALYYPGDSVSHINDALVKVYREDNSSVVVKSKSARLHTEGTTLGSAELEGEVSVNMDQSLGIKTDFAVYNSEKRTINAPGFVEITGQGYQVSGLGLDVYIDSDRLRLSNQVKSSFNSGGSIPKLKGFNKK